MAFRGSGVYFPIMRTVTAPRRPHVEYVIKRGTAALIAAALAFLLASCSSGRPPVPDGLSAAEPLPVKKKLFILFSGERLNFGDYSVDKVRRDSSVDIERPRSSRIAVRLQDKYTFRMTGGGEGDWRGDCVSDANRQDEIPFLGPLHETGYRVALRCNLSGPDSGTAWKLELVEEDTAGRILKGMLTGGSEAMKVTGSRELGRKYKEDSHTGFEISAGDQAMGAVLLTKGDRVLFHPSASDGVKPVLAAASAALILYLDSNERMKEIVETRLQSERDLFL